jgi:hypothetical protein
MSLRNIGGEELRLHQITFALEGSEWLISSLDRFTTWKVILYPLNSSLYGYQSCSERYEEDKRLFSLPGFQTTIFQTVEYSLQRIRSSTLKKSNIRKIHQVFE